MKIDTHKLGTSIMGVLGVYYLYFHYYLVGGIYLLITMVLVIIIIREDYQEYIEAWKVHYRKEGLK